MRNRLLNKVIGRMYDVYTPSPEEAEFSGLTAGVGTIQLRP